MKYISLENLQTYNTEIKKYIDTKSDYEEFVGTKEEWDALSEEEKEKYKDGIVNITDDFVPSSGEGGGRELDLFIDKEDGVLKQTFGDETDTKSPIISDATLQAINANLNEIEQAILNAPAAKGEGDMVRSVYDPDNAILNAGGIKAYVDSLITSSIEGSY